jgi:hypothetical protein
MGKRGLQLLDVGPERGITINVSYGVAQGHGHDFILLFEMFFLREFRESLLLIIINGHAERICILLIVTM